VTTTATPDRFTTLPDEPALQATVVALEEHGFSVEVVGDLDAARQAVLAHIPEGSGVIGLAQLVVVFDLTVMNIALPSAQRALHFTTVDRQ